jgi:hypothetical protein
MIASLRSRNLRTERRSIAEAAFLGELEIIDIHCHKIAVRTKATFATVKQLGAEASAGSKAAA